MKDNTSLYDRIHEQHGRKLKDLFRLVNSENKLLYSYQLWGSLLFSSLYIVYIAVNEIDLLTIIDMFAKLSITILPTIIGFNIGGYVLFVSIGSSKILMYLVDRYEGDNSRKADKAVSTYQHISSVFAWSIFIQILALILSYIYALIISLKIQNTYANYLNIVALILISWISLYAILLVYRIVMNVFTIGQVQHFNEVCNKLENKKSEKNEESETE